MNRGSRRDQVVAATMVGISEQGFSTLGTREIARRAGVSIGTLQHHFDGKSEIIYECLLRSWNEWIRIARQALESAGTPVDRLERLIESALQEPEMDELWRVHIAFEPEVGFDLQLREAAFQANQKWDELIAATVREGIATGQLHGDERIITQRLAVVINGVGQSRHMYPPRLTHRESIDLCRAVLRIHQMPEPEPAG